MIAICYRNTYLKGVIGVVCMHVCVLEYVVCVFVCVYMCVCSTGGANITNYIPPLPWRGREARRSEAAVTCVPTSASRLRWPGGRDLGGSSHRLDTEFSAPFEDLRALGEGSQGPVVSNHQGCFG